MENETHVSHFPAHGFVFVSKTKRGALAADRFAPAPGSFFDEKMLLRAHDGTRLRKNGNIDVFIRVAELYQSVD